MARLAIQPVSPALSVIWKLQLAYICLVCHACKVQLLKHLQFPGVGKTTTTVNPCGDNSYLCGSGNCIPNDWLCDGVSDCLLGEDEASHTCGQFHSIIIAFSAVHLWVWSKFSLWEWSSAKDLDRVWRESAKSAKLSFKRKTHQIQYTYIYDLSGTKQYHDQHLGKVSFYIYFWRWRRLAVTVILLNQMLLVLYFSNKPWCISTDGSNHSKAELFPVPTIPQTLPTLPTTTTTPSKLGDDMPAHGVATPQIIWHDKEVTTVAKDFSVPNIGLLDNDSKLGMDGKPIKPKQRFKFMGKWKPSQYCRIGIL